MAKKLSAESLVREFSRPARDAAGKKIRTINLHGLRTAAKLTGLKPLEIEIAALETGIIPARYLRNMGTIGLGGQLKLLRSIVAVCGAGGLGGTIIELLARQGVGHLVIIDNGRFVENNLNRQIMLTEWELGKAKARVAAHRVNEINSAVIVSAVNKRITPSNAGELVAGCDVVMDALDSAETRLALAKACAGLKIPFVHGAIAGFCGQFMTVMPGDRGLETIYGLPGGQRARGIEAFTGNPPATPAAIAAMQVHEAVKTITGIGSPMRNRLAFLDFSEGSLEEMKL